MNNELLAKSLEKIPDRMILVNLASRRAKELARGANPLVKVVRNPVISYLDVALQEIVDGKLTYVLGEE